MDATGRPLHWAETSAVLYLVIPLFIFLASFVRFEIAVPACALIAFLAYDMVRQTLWREFLILRWESLYFLGLAAVWMWLSGGIGPLALTQNTDWAKHNLIINFLAEHSWPASEKLPHFGTVALRYYIGWHLVPSLIVKLFHAPSSVLAASIWSIVGVFLFFSLLPGLVGKRTALIVAAPLTFILFGGADIIGTYITQYSVGPPYHFEWWAGWAQFSSNTTALFWSPQQALPAWLGAALLMRCRHTDRLLPFCALLASAILLWSPLVTIGLVPFLITLAVQRGPLSIAFGWRAIASTLLLALPVGLYLISGSGAIPHDFIGKFSCTQGPCFTWLSYFLFLAIEVGATLTILFLRKQPEQGFLLAAASALCLIPLFKMGVFNDFAMRASLPSLAVLAILFSKLFAGPRPYPVAALAVLLLAFPSIFGEFSRGFLPDSKPAVIDLATIDKTLGWWIDQTFTRQPSWVLRKPSEEI